MEANITCQALITHFNVSVSGQPARLRRGRSRGSWQTGSRKQRGRRSGEGVRGDNGVPAPGRRPGEGVRGDNRVPPPHPIHIRRQKQGKAPPCVVIRALRSYYVRIIKVFGLKCMVPTNHLAHKTNWQLKKTNLFFHWVIKGHVFLSVFLCYITHWQYLGISLWPPFTW